MKIADARAVITGGASGLGHAVAQLVRAQGGQVALLDVQDAAGCGRSQELGAGAHYYHCDVTSEAAVNAAMAAAAAAMGGLNLLVNCAGIGGSARTLGKNGPMPGELYAKVDPDQPDRHLSVRQGGGGHHAEEHAERRGRARPDRAHLFGRRLRRADRPGGLLGHQGGRGRA